MTKRGESIRRDEDAIEFYASSSICIIDQSDVAHWPPEIVDHRGKQRTTGHLFLNVNELQTKGLDWRTNHTAFVLSPSLFYVNVNSAMDDIPSADATRTLLKDLREARQSKARQGVHSLGESYLQVCHLLPTNKQPEAYNVLLLLCCRCCCPFDCYLDTLFHSIISCPTPCTMNFSRKQEQKWHENLCQGMWDRRTEA